MIYTIDEIAERIRPVVKKYGILRVYLFGSYARGDANDESDVDLLVDTKGVAHKPFWLGGLYGDLCEALNKEVDMITINTLEECHNDPSDRRFAEEVELDKKEIAL